MPQTKSSQWADLPAARLLRAALGTPWLAHIRPTDLRFGFDGPENVLELCRKLDAGQLAYSPERAAYLRRVMNAANNTFVEDVAELCDLLAHAKYTAEDKAKSRERFRHIFLRRHGCLPGGSTLDAIGKSLSPIVTREGVRIALERVLAVAAGHTIACSSTHAIQQRLRGKVPVPALLCLLELRDLLGGAIQIDNVLAFIQDVQHEAPQFELRERIVDGRPAVFVETADGGEPWHAAAWRIAAALTAVSGGAQMDYVAGRVMFEHAVTVGRAQFAAALERHPGFRWLDQGSGWFTLQATGDAAQCLVEQRVHKVMAVARDSVDAGEIASAIRADNRAPGRRDGAPPPLPLAALSALLSTWPWLSRGQPDGFRPNQQFDAAGLLSETESAIVEAIEHYGGIATTYEILDRVVGRRCARESAVATALASAPFVRPLEPDICGLRGRALDAAALARAQQSLAALHIGPGRLGPTPPAAPAVETEAHDDGDLLM